MQCSATATAEQVHCSAVRDGLPSCSSGGTMQSTVHVQHATISHAASALVGAACVESACAASVLAATDVLICLMHMSVCPCTHVV